MKTTRFDLIIAFLLFGLLLIGALTRAAAQQNKAKSKADKTVMIYERKPCFGYCPTYKAEFLTSGLVKVTSMQHVKLATQPEFTFQLTSDEICQLFTSAERQGFFKFPDRFKTQISDFPARELTLYKKGQPKTVIFEENPPEGIKDVTNQLESIIESKINSKE